MDIASWTVSSEQTSGVFGLETASSFCINDGYGNEPSSGNSFPDVHVPQTQFANTSLEISPKTLRTSPTSNNYCWTSSLPIDHTLVPPTFNMDANANCNSNHDCLTVANSASSFELLLNYFGVTLASPSLATFVGCMDEKSEESYYGPESGLMFMPAEPAQEVIGSCTTQERFQHNTGESLPSQPEVTGEAQYHCTQKNCKRKHPFTRKADLKRHELIHTGVKPYNCQFEGCVRIGENAFRRRDKLREHQRKAHGLLWGEYAAIFRSQ